MRQRDQSAQVGIALFVFGQQRQVDGAGPRVDQAMAEGDLDASDGLHASSGAGLGELHGSVQAIVIRNRERAITEVGST